MDLWRSTRRGWMLGIAGMTVSSPAWATADAIVKLEVATQPGVSPTASQEWLNVLKGLDFAELRIRSARGDEVPEALSEDQGRSWRVVGVMTPNGTLVLPNGKFTQGDRRAIGAWLVKLKTGGLSGGAGAGGGKPVPFGLTPDQIVALYEGLAAPVSFSTRGQPSIDVVKRIRSNITIQVAASGNVASAFEDDEGVRDELQGIASGTALAAVLRPLGLVLIPDGMSSPVRLTMAKASDSKLIWPVGWPPDKKPGEMVPLLLKFIEVEISDTTLAEALEAMQERLQIPFLLDHNGLARQRIDPTRIQVTIRKGKTFYSKILDQLVAQAKLKWEMRVDEAGRPLAWVSPQLG